MELTRYGVSSHDVARYGVSLRVWVHSPGMGRVYAMCWSSMSLSVKIGKAVSQTLPLPPPTLHEN